MEFDRSKENIQPLRGGRNVTQLGVALQAQNDSESQRELMQQKRTYEESIRTYDGDDPLENWYTYIYWVEQSYPKHGHEGNLISVLEDCLSKFENDERYMHDRRLCKLWIKYIDLQQNPLELFQLLYSKGICVSCADLYRAWAFYHEIAGDYKRADAVFQLGLRALAQPFEELNFAHQNMFMAIGKEAIQGIDEKRREEERQVLTSLASYSYNHRTMVPSVRVGSNVLSQSPGVLPTNSRPDRSNAPITLYEDLEVAGPSIGACASVSVLEVARKQEIVHKENTLKPGTWKKSIITKKVPQPRQPTFKVHEDEDPAYAGGIRLPPDFAPMNFDDFSNWKTDLFFPEPHDDSKIPMYPKHIVYGTPDVEFSPEEIRARKWYAKKESEMQAKNDSCITMQETMMEDANIIAGNQGMHTEIEQAVQSILPPTTDADPIIDLQNSASFVVPRLSYFPQNISAYETDKSLNTIASVPEEPRVSVYQDVPQQMPNQYNMSQVTAPQNAYYHEQLVHPGINHTKLPQVSATQMYTHHDDQNREILGAAGPVQHWPNNTINSDDNYTQNMREAMKSVNDIWKDSLTIMQDSVHHHPVQKPVISKFQIHEDTVLTNTERQRQEAIAIENKNSNGKLQFSIYEESEHDQVTQPNLGATGNSAMGYRKVVKENMRAPFSSQPLAEPDQVPCKTSSYSEPLSDENFVCPMKVPSGLPLFPDVPNASSPAMNDTCTTQQFFSSLNNASTPYNYRKIQQFTAPANQNVLKTKKLFEDTEKVQQEEAGEPKTLSMILETTKEYRNSSSSGSSSVSGNTLKTTTFYRESLKVIPENSHTYEESVVNEMQNKIDESHHVIANNASMKEIDNPDVNNYNMVKMLLKSDSPVGGVSRKSYATQITNCSQNFIDLTEDDSVMPKPSTHRMSEVGQDVMQTQQSMQKTLMNNYESPMKNQFREMTCDSSNDSLSNSPVKGHKMDVDFNLSQNSNSEFRMDDHFDETILQKVPSDPFNNKLTSALLRKIGFPNPKYSRQYIQLQSLPRLIGKKEVVSFADEKYSVEKVIGKGAFGSVYRAINLHTGQMVALKYQKPANKWEYYIIKEIKERVTNPYMVSAYMDVIACYISPNASVLASTFIKYGSLLDLANKVKKVNGKGLKELISIYYATEIINIVNTLHKCNIIHADIKPDNFLVTRLPPEFGYPSLQLIDYGNSIDMTLFPKGTVFTTGVNTENFVCTEMKDGKPWTYQTDIFCIAATVHVLLFDKYMQLQKNGSVWTISQHIPRYMRQDLWKTFFFQMLNIESCDHLPDLNQIKSSFDSILQAQSEELQMELRMVANTVLGR